MHEFLLNMWIMKKIDGPYLSQMVINKYITEEEKQMIVVTPQL